jgi:hypothetical protein
MTIKVTHSKVSTIPDGDDTSVVRPSDWNDDHVLVGLGTAAELDAGVANGVATLDATGKVPTSELPAAILGALNYQGTWNATTNTPTLTSSVGTKGYYYVVSVAGTTNLNGITDWQVGDWAVYNGTEWQKVDNTDAGGDVVGPASATDNAVARFDSTTGKLLQNSVVTVSDTGDIDGAQSISNLDYAQFDTTVTSVEAVAKLQWDDGNGTLQVGLKGGNVNLQVGQEVVARVYNDSGTNLVDGQIVYISGAQGNRIAVKLAKADSEITSAGTLGMVTEPIAIGAEGFITIMGTVNKLNTTGLTAGALLYLSATTAGAYTETIPTAPNHKVTIGYVERISTTVGSIYVKVDNGYELQELHNVNIVSPTGGNLLVYDQTNGYWKNANLTDGTAISITESTDGAITIANTAPDQTVSITGAGTTTVTGTYPNFTVTSNDQYVGTVTSVTGTAPVSVATGTTTPVISMAAANSTTNGYLTSTDWTTFNNKTSNTGTVTSVSTSGTVNGLTLTGGPITTSGTVTLGGTLDLSSPPTIGNTAANTGAFTTLSASGQLTLTNASNYNLYASGAGANYMAAKLGIGATPTANANLYLGSTITGGTNAFGVYQVANIATDVTGTAYPVRTNIGINASATVGGVTHFSANQATFTGTATSQYGFLVESSLIGATNNYGFYGNIASGTGRWNLYMNGTANNYMAGSLGIGTTSLSDRNLAISKTLTGATTVYGVIQNGTVQSDVTTNAYGFRNSLLTAASAFTLTGYIHYQAIQGSIGATSAVSNQYGFLVDASVIGATNNYGFIVQNLAAVTSGKTVYAYYSSNNIATGGGTSYNLYMAGTAPNYFAGDMQFNKTVTAAGTTGAQTINKNAGTVNFAAAATSLVVTNSLVTTSSIIVCTVGTNDTTMKSVSAVAGSGLFTIYANAAATAETRVNFIVIN